MHARFSLAAVPAVLIAGLVASVSAQAVVGDREADGISTTQDGRILVELAPEDTIPARPFDLNERTLVLTPDGWGGYSRSVQPLAWEEDLGAAVADGTEIALSNFTFDFAGRLWGSFHVSRHGLLTFGEPLAYSYWDVSHRFDGMRAIAANFATTPTIAPLYKPHLGGRHALYGATQHVAQRPDRVVVTWITSEPDYYVHGVPPERPARFQVVLSADASIRFSYADVFIGDGIVGLFDEPARGDLIESIVDGTDAGLPGHVDLLEAAVYESDVDAVILEFTTRDAVPVPESGAAYKYRLFFDTDEPYWTEFGDGSDLDLVWSVDVQAGGEHTAPTGGRVIASDGNRLALLVDLDKLSGGSAMVMAHAAQFADGRYVRGDLSYPVPVTLPDAAPMADLSRPDSQPAGLQREVFHYRHAPDLAKIACRVVVAFGDAFDLFVFHSEFRVDSQETASPWTGYRSAVKGIGSRYRKDAPCGAGRLKGHWRLPVWMQSAHVANDRRQWSERGRFDRGLMLFAHELTHAWTAHLSYEVAGINRPLSGDYCRCHWRFELHAPAAFPWHAQEPGPRSLMGGRFWRDNRDGTFTPLNGYWGGGHSWLDLYAMGLADASEVPDMFVLRNLRPARADNPYGPHAGEREWVSIDQVVAAEGARAPPAAFAQKVFNAGFVYLLEPGTTATADMLALHGEYRDKVIEHWSHVTGRRSAITTLVPRSP